MQVKLTKHDFFDPIIPYIIEMETRTQKITIELPKSINLDSDEIMKYFKDAILQTSRKSSRLCGIIKDKEIFSYLLSKLRYTL